MVFKSNIMDENDIRRVLIRMSHEIIEKNRGTKNLALVGLAPRGIVLAREMSEIIKIVERKPIDVGMLELKLDRKGLFTSVTECVTKSEIPFNIDNSNIVLVDDVLYTGRTVHAAMEALAAMGQPKTLQLAVLIDRMARDLPIAADYTGKSVPGGRDELISVSVKELDNRSSVDIYTM